MPSRSRVADAKMGNNIEQEGATEDKRDVATSCVEKFDAGGDAKQTYRGRKGKFGKTESRD